MATHHEPAGRPPLPSVHDDPLGYWWPVCRGEEIMRAFHAAPELDAWRVVERHPALLLPEIVDAAERMLGPTRALAGLREMHHTLRGSPAYAPYHRLLAAALAKERRGSRRVNLERALAVVKDVRRAAAGDPADERAEQAIRAALDALTPLPGARAPAVHALFLDDAELAGLRCSDDRRAINPSSHDRAFAVHGGLAAGTAEWLGDVGAPVHRVIDARWVFASSKAAKAYLDAPGTQLLARDDMASPAVLPIADGAHAWGRARSAQGRAGRQCVLFRVDRVVARLDVTEGPKAAQELQSLSRAHVLPYADAVVRRVRRVLAQYWLAIGRGTVAAQKLVQAPPRKDEQLFAEYPILLLPEFPTAMATLGDGYRAAAERLPILQAKTRNNWQGYRELLRTLVRGLLDEAAGEPRINADAALRA
ncbi:MAG: hypothetical protein E6J90_16585 [Deltaproteobacteria bacterium]|nr:MAG: hypothetical protein E6J90_16585 [Deltaproteobacteria bacterium]